MWLTYLPDAIHFDILRAIAQDKGSLCYWVYRDVQRTHSGSLTAMFGHFMCPLNHTKRFIVTACRLERQSDDSESKDARLMWHNGD